MKDSGSTQPFGHVGIVGAGAWGTALAQVAAQAGRRVTLWAFEADVVESINVRRENAAFLPGPLLHPAIHATTALSDVAVANLILLVTPAQHMRATLSQLAPQLSAGMPIVLCSKGIEQSSSALMTEVAAASAPDARVAVLSGPGFAKDVVRGLPTATTIACAEIELARDIVETLGLPTFRPYISDDLIGAEIGGAVKNVIAVACGVAEGRRLGDGARAALITRGFAELARLGRALGARAETLNGLCGLGDLVLTCSSLTSRNMSLGVALGEGRSARDVLSERRSVAEGAASAPALVALAERMGVEMPISEAVDAVIAGRMGVDDAIGALLARPFRAEGF